MPTRPEKPLSWLETPPCSRFSPVGTQVIATKKWKRPVLGYRVVSRETQPFFEVFASETDSGGKMTSRFLSTYFQRSFTKEKTQRVLEFSRGMAGLNSTRAGRIRPFPVPIVRLRRFCNPRYMRWDWLLVFFNVTGRMGVEHHRRGRRW